MLPCCRFLLHVYKRNTSIVACFKYMHAYSKWNMIPLSDIYYFFLCEIFQEGLARLEKRNRRDRKERQLAPDNLETFQGEARTSRRGMWQYGDIQSDDEDTAPPARKAGGRR